MSTIWFLIIAVISALCWALMNIFDKYVLDKKIKKIWSYYILTGIIYMLIALSIALFLPWNNIRATDVIFPGIAGILLALEGYIYMWLLKKDDATNVLGLTYFSPLLVAVFAYIFLHEKIPWIGYVGMFLIIIGSLVLSLRLAKLRIKMSLILMGLLIIGIGIEEFFIKISTTQISEFNGFVITLFFEGLIFLAPLFSRTHRKNIKKEMPNIPWIFVTDIWYFLALGTLYVAMSGLPAGIVSAIGATHLLFLLFFEKIAEKIFPSMSKDKVLKYKFIGIILIVIGVALVSYVA